MDHGEQQTGGHMADVDMSDVGPPTDHNPTSTSEETLKLLYDLDALTQIPEGEFIKGIPPPSIGEFTKPASKSTSTQDGQPGPSSVPAGAESQGDDDDEEESDNEYDERPPRSTNPRTLEERLRREIEYIDDMFEQDEEEDEQNMAVPCDQWRAADFIVDDMV
ncbi:unnamed protein product [Closterium sp. NIES-54]